MARELALISQPEPLSEEAALATLTAAGRTVTGFARQLGVGAHPRRALKRWEAAGHITRLTDDAGRLVILANTIEPTAPLPSPLPGWSSRSTWCRPQRRPQLRSPAPALAPTASLPSP